ncbi:hypothetical protein QYF36_010309 [Acer negundo]|nr:hypothetical protein QYF36_010309 [Acer negundo]
MQHGQRQLNTIPIIQMTIPRQAKQKTKRVALVMAFFSAAAVSAQDLAPSSTPAVGAGVSLLVSGAVVGFSLDVSALALI